MKKQLLIFLFIVCAFNTYAQTRASDSILHVKYWNYRQNFLKYFTIVGPDQGMSVPGSKINKWANPMYCDYFRITINSVTKKKRRLPLPPETELPQYSYYADYGDATAHYAEYLGVLATEYWLLKHYNTDTMGLKAVKNEIYFALNAIDRLDKYSEAYFSNFTSPGKLNGFIHRDDLPNRHLEDLYKYDRHAPRNNFGNTSGVYHIDTMHIDGKVIYFGPDSIQLKPEKNPWDYGYKRPEWEIEKGGQPSQDQMIGILTGLKFVQNYVDWDLEVDPDGDEITLEKRNLVSWTAQIADRMLKKISETAIGIKFYDGETFENLWKHKCKKDLCGKKYEKDKTPCFKCESKSEWMVNNYKPNNQTIANSANYVLKDENGDHVFRGPYAYGFGYPLEKIGEELARANNAVANPNYPSVSVKLDDDERYLIHVASVGYSALATPFGIIAAMSPFGRRKNLITGLTELNTVNFSCGGLNLLGVNGYSQCLLGRPFDATNPNWFRDLWNALPKKDAFKVQLSGDQGDLTMNMVQFMAPISSTWSHQEYKELMDYTGRDYMELVYATLQNNSAIRTKSYYADLLNKAQFNNHTFMNKANKTINAPWSRGSLFSNINNDNKDEFQGVSSGLDYMLIYNMYRINSIRFWGDSYNKYFNDPSPNGDGEFWEIEINPRHIHILPKQKDNEEQYRNTNVNKWGMVFRENLPYESIDTFQSKVPYSSYLNYGIQTPDIVSTDFNVNNNGVFIINYLVNVVNHKKFTVNNGGKLFVKEAPKYTSGLRHKFYIRDGSTLELKSGSILTIENNAEVIIPKGATLIIHPGAQIILNGPNAVIHINGKMILKPNADFNPIAGANGYGKVVFENHAGELYVKCEGNNKVIINPGTKGPHINLEAKGAYGMHTGWQPGLRLFEVKNAKVGVAAGSKITSEAVNTVIDNIQMEGKNWPQNENEYSNGLLLYSTDATIQNSYFDFFENALEFSYHSYLPQSRPTLKNNTFWRCKTGVKMNGGSVWAEGNQFSSHKIGVRGIYGVSTNGLSVIRSNKFDIAQNIANQWSWSPSSPRMAIQFHNTGSNNLLKNQFNGSNYAIYSMDGKMTLTCNKFDGSNDLSTAYHAINARNGSISMSKGYNLFQQYQNYIVSGNSRLNLDKGYNLFDINQRNYPFILELNKIQKLVSSVGVTLATKNNQAILARYNYWHSLNTTTNASLFRPASQTNENLYIIKGEELCDLGYNPFSNASGNYIGIQDDYCSQDFTFNPRTADIAYDEEEPYNILENLGQMAVMPVRSIKPPTIDDGDTYYDVITSILVNLNDGIVDYTTVLPELIYLNNADLPSSSFDVSYYTYSLMHDIYSDGLSDTFNHDSMSVYINTYGNMLLANQDTLINKCLNNDSFWSSMRYELFRDKAMLLRSLDRRDEAIVLLDSAIVDPLIPDMLKSHATAWRCVINQEVMLIDSVITIADIDFELCMPEDSMQVNSPYTFVNSDTTFYLCNADSINGNNLTMSYTVLDTLPFVVYNAYSDTVFADTLQQFTLPLGDYTVVATDTGAQIVYMHYIHVTQNRDCYPEVIAPSYTSTDTSFYLCYDGVQSLDSVYYVYQADSTLPYVLIKNTSDTLSQNVNHQYQLSFGNYTFAYIDTALNIFNNDYVKIEFNDSCTVVPEEYTFQIIDTTFSICYIDSSNLDLLTYHYLPDTTLPYTIYNEYTDTIFTDTMHSYRLPLGNFVNVAIDSINNILHLTYIHIVFDSSCIPPDTIFQTSDTTLYFCNDGIKSFDSLYVWYPIESHLIHEVYLGGVTLVNPYIPYLYQLRAGTYTIITYDSNTLTHHTASVAVSPNYIDVSYFSDTFSYDCELGYYGLNIYDNHTLVYDENDDLVTETSTNYYELDAVNHQYKTIYTNLETCESEETTLHFIDEYYLPESAEADIYGDFNTETDTCAFFKVDELMCNGNAINSSPTIEVFDIASVHLLTTSFVYHETRGNGFYFCPPYWNNEPEHIYDWYSLVIRTDFCDYCRFDFRYDSTGIYDRSSSLTNATLIKNRVMLYPNPANQDVNIHILGVAETGLETITIQILDQTGRILEDKVHALNKDGNIKLSMEQYTNGVYFIKIPALKYDGKVVLIKE